MYILLCSNGCYYTGSTNNLERRLAEHQNGEGANFTRKHLPVELVYYEEHQRIDEAFYREKQVQGWSRKKKEALINGRQNLLHDLSECRNDSHFKNKCLDVPFGSAQGTDNRSLSETENSPLSGAANRSLSGVETNDARIPQSHYHDGTLVPVITKADSLFK